MAQSGSSTLASISEVHCTRKLALKLALNNLYQSREMHTCKMYIKNVRCELVHMMYNRVHAQLLLLLLMLQVSLLLLLRVSAVYAQ